jgi:hypothetical protein
MKLSLEKVDQLCRENRINVSALLRETGVSRNSFYSLARKDTLVPSSLVRIAEYLGVPIADLLEHSFTPSEKIKAIQVETARITSRYPDLDSDNVRHTLLLLEERPEDRLRRALRRGRSVDIR